MLVFDEPYTPKPLVLDADTPWPVLDAAQQPTPLMPDPTTPGVVLRPLDCP